MPGEVGQHPVRGGEPLLYAPQKEKWGRDDHNAGVKKGIVENREKKLRKETPKITGLTGRGYEGLGL